MRVLRPMKRWRGSALLSGSHWVRLCERVEHDEAFEVGHGGGEQGLEARLSSASVTGFAHAQVLEVVDLAFDLGPLAEQGLGGGFVLSGSGRLAAVMGKTHSYNAATPPR